MTRTLTSAIAVLALLSGPAAAQVLASFERPALRAEATITGKVVRIGDLIDNAGAAANVPIFRAPDLGSTGSVPAARVIEAVRGHAIIGLDTGAISDITVTRASRAIPADEIETSIASALSRDFGLGEAGDIAITFDRPLHTVHVEPSATGALRVNALRFEQRSGRFDVSLEIASDAVKLRLTGAAAATREVLTVNRGIARGEILKISDITMERRPRAEIAADTIADPELAIGLAARTAINTGRALRSADLMRPEIVQRNETVTIVYEVPGIVLSMRGKAIESGADGDMIDVINIQSKRTVRGIVAGPGRVVVSSMAARIVAAAGPEDVSALTPRDGAKRE